MAAADLRLVSPVAAVPEFGQDAINKNLRGAWEQTCFRHVYS
jgi:hypothetical protein